MGETDPGIDDPEIQIQPPAISKSYRYLSGPEIRQKIQTLKGQLYREGNSDRYHLLTTGSHRTGGAVVIVVAVDEGERLAVVTQMGVHTDYSNDDGYTRMNDEQRALISRAVNP